MFMFFVVYLVFVSVFVFPFFFEKISKEGQNCSTRWTVKIHKMDTSHSFWRFKGVGPEDQSRKEITIDLMVACFWMTTGFDIT
jgi:hypothetical protein